MERRCYLIILWLVMVFHVGQFTWCYAQGGNELISDVRIQGNKAVSSDLILSKIRTRPGQKKNSLAISEDIKALYGTGYFDDITVKYLPDGGKVIVQFVVDEKPKLRDIVITGNKKIKTKKLLDMIKSSKGEIINEVQIKEDVQEIKKYYYDKGYVFADVDVKITEDPSAGEAILTLTVDEGTRKIIRGITIEGNKAFSDKKLKKLFKTKKRWFFIRKGILKEDVLEEDLKNLKKFYQSKGYIDMTVVSVEKIEGDNGDVEIVITVQEGKTYKIGTISISGCTVFDKADISNELELSEGDIFTPLDFAKSVKTIKDMYWEKGYINCVVKTQKTYNADTGRLDLVYTVIENQVSYVNQVTITGNTKTKDIVIRRELDILPGEKFDGVKLQKNLQKIKNLGYFEDVGLELLDTPVADKKDVLIQVSEKKTGQISFGAGFSSIDSFIAFAEIMQSNFDLWNWPTFTGGGQKLRLRVEAGSRRDNYILSFVEPWFLGRKLMFGTDFYIKDRNIYRSDYNENAKGFDVKLGRPLTEFTRGEIIYRLEEVTIDADNNASSLIRAEDGTRTYSSIAVKIDRDTRDSIFLTHTGNRTILKGEVSGLGGDTDIYKLTLQHTYYVTPMEKVLPDNTLMFNLEGGLVDTFGNTDHVPIFERFFLGGPYTIRGFKYRDVGPRDVFDEALGGEVMVLLNAEYSFPIVQSLRGACFFDAGNVYYTTNDIDLGELSGAVGIGLRLNLPGIPIQVDYGFPVLTDVFTEGEDKPVFSFSVGNIF